MPQIIFEHSDNLIGIDYDGMFAEIYEQMKTIPNIGTCKMRSVPRSQYYIGTENGETGFAFFRVLMAPKAERDDAFRDEIARRLIPILCRYLDPIKKKLGIKCFPTLEMGVLSKQYYWVQ